MLRNLLRPLLSPFCTHPLPDPLSPLRSKHSSGHLLQDYQYSKLIQDLLLKKQSLSAYNLLIHTYLHNILLDKQIFFKVEKSLGESEETYKDVLKQMYGKYFKEKQKAIVLKKNNKQKEMSQRDRENEQTKKFQAILRQTANTKIHQPQKLLKDGELFITDLFSKIDLQKITFKNVRINFDYDWISQLDKIRSEMNESEREINEKREQEEKQLADDQVFVSQEEDEGDEYESEELTLEDMIRSIKSIDIGEVELVSNGNKEGKKE